MDAPNTCVLTLSLPPAALCGINLVSFTTTPRFHGIKNLPPGWHFVFISSSASLSVRHGAWFYVNGTTSHPEVFIKRWDTATEQFVEADGAEMMKRSANLGSVWRDCLTPYRQSASTQDEKEEERRNAWTRLTGCITEEILDRITGRNPNHWSLSSASSARRDMDIIPGLPENASSIQEEKELDFLPIDLKKTWRDGAMGRERTEAAQDRSWALGDIIENHCAGREQDILGEMQFCFLVVITLNNYSCLEQWKRILGLILTCKAAVKQRPKLFKRAVSLLRLQLQHFEDMETSLFDLSDEGATLLVTLLRKFKKGLEDISSKEKADVIDELEELENFLRSEYNWEFDNAAIVRKGMLQLEDGEEVEMEISGFDEDEEQGEYAPTIVQLTPEQLRALTGNDDPTGAINEDPEVDDRDLDEMDARY